MDIRIPVLAGKIHTGHGEVETLTGDGLNLYAYCANNSVTYYDLSGYWTKGNEQVQDNAIRKNTSLKVNEPDGVQGGVGGPASNSWEMDVTS